MMPATILDNAVEDLLARASRPGASPAMCARGRRDAAVTAGDKQLRVSRAAADLPFRWMVSEGERTRGVTSIAGLLRTVRAAVDPGYRPIRLRIAPLPLLPP